MKLKELHHGQVLPILLLAVSIPVLGIAHLFGVLPVAGLVLFLCAAILTILFKKIYHVLVLAGVCLLFFVYIEPSPSDLLFCVALPLGLISGLYKPRLQGPAFYVVLLFAGYFIACLPGIALAMDQSESIRYYAITLYLFAIAFFLATYARTSNIRSILLAYIVAAFCSFLAGLVGYLGFFSDILMADSFRVRGFFKDPNVFGPFFVPAILMLVDDFSKRKLLRTKRIVHLFLIITMTLGVIFSFSRGAWINLAVTLFMYYLLKGELLKFLKPKRLIPILFVLAALVFVFTLPFMEETGLSEFISDRAQLQDYDSNRFSAQEGGLQLLLDNLWGCGPGQFENNIASITRYKLSAHSLFIRTAAENGILGFLFFFGAIGYLMVSLLRNHIQLRKAAKRNSSFAPAVSDTSLSVGTSPAVFSISHTPPAGEAYKLTSGNTKGIIAKDTPTGLSSAVTIAVLCGLLVSSLAVDTLHWRSFWVFIGIGLYELNQQWSEKKKIRTTSENYDPLSVCQDARNRK